MKTTYKVSFTDQKMLKDGNLFLIARVHSGSTMCAYLELIYNPDSGEASMSEGNRFQHRFNLNTSDLKALCISVAKLNTCYEYTPKVNIP